MGYTKNGSEQYHSSITFTLSFILVHQKSIRTFMASIFSRFFLQAA